MLWFPQDEGAESAESEPEQNDGSDISEEEEEGKLDRAKKTQIRGSCQVASGNDPGHQGLKQK